jgi:hypothetical protein
MFRDHRHPKWIFLRIFFGILFVSVISLVLMLLWNWLMPLLFGIKVINYLQAVGLLILSKILFSGIGMQHRNHDRKHEDWHRKFHAEFEKSMNNMSKE